MPDMVPNQLETLCCSGTDLSGCHGTGSGISAAAALTIFQFLVISPLPDSAFFGDSA